jgi:hypothetical protein
MSDTRRQHVDDVEAVVKKFHYGPYDMAEEIVGLRAAIERVRALHASVEIGFGPICDECSSASDGWIVPYPCPTLRALDGDDA